MKCSDTKYKGSP